MFNVWYYMYEKQNNGNSLIIDGLAKFNYYLFLAAMSSSRSHNVTMFVHLSVRNLISLPLKNVIKHVLMGECEIFLLGNIFLSKIKNIFWPTKKSSNQKKVPTKKNFRPKKIYDQKKFLTKKISNQKKFPTKNLFRPTINFQPKKNVRPKFFF